MSKSGTPKLFYPQVCENRNGGIATIIERREKSSQKLYEVIPKVIHHLWKGGQVIHRLSTGMIEKSTSSPC